MSAKKSKPLNRTMTLGKQKAEQIAQLRSGINNIPNHSADIVLPLQTIVLNSKRKSSSKKQK